MRLLFFALALVLLAPAARAAEADVYCLTGTRGDGASPNWQPAASATPCPVTTTATGTTPVITASLSTTVVTVVAAAATFTSYYCYNPNAAVAYVQIFDVSGSVTLGTTVPKWSLGIPAGGGANLAGLSLTFANAIKVAATTTATGLTANSTALDCNFGYR